MEAMEKKICLLCDNLCGDKGESPCLKFSSELRKYEIWNTPERSQEICELIAENCNNWEEDKYLKKVMEEKGLVNR